MLSMIRVCWKSMEMPTLSLTSVYYVDYYRAKKWVSLLSNFYENAEVESEINVTGRADNRAPWYVIK